MSLDFLNGFLEDFNKKADGAAQEQRAATSPYNTRLSPTPQKLIPYPKIETKPKKKKKKDEPFKTDLKNFFTGKDTDGDGKPNGLFKALEIIDRPGDAVRTGIKEKAEGGSFWEGAKDGFLGKKDTLGKEVNQALGFDTSKGLPHEIAKFVARGFVGQGPNGKLYTPVLNDKIAKEVGTETLGIGTELVTDPLNYVGVGIGKYATKGIKTASTRTMQNLLPDNEAIAKTITNTLKADTALPVKPNRPNPMVLDELIPRGNDITNPNYVSSILPQPKTQIDIPRVGKPLDEALANPKPDIGQPILQPSRVKELTPHTPEPIAKPLEQPKIEPTQPLERPENLKIVEGERKHYSTLTNSEKATDEFINGIKNLDRSYQKISDKEVVDFANGMVNRDVEEAFQFVKNAERFDKRHTAVGARLLDVLQQNKEFEKAVDLADVLAKEGTKAGQSLQSFSVYNRLSAEGHLIRAQRRVIKLNQTLPEGKKITLTPEITEDIAAAADSIQKLTGQQEIGSNVISLLEKAKKGNTLTDEELRSVQSFMADAKK